MEFRKLNICWSNSLICSINSLLGMYRWKNECPMFIKGFILSVSFTTLRLHSLILEAHIEEKYLSSSQVPTILQQVWMVDDKFNKLSNII